MRTTSLTKSAQLKKDIQALLRQIVMLRDKACIRCGVPVGTEGVVFQADHLLSRAHSATYADARLVVCICRNCHGWKSLGSNLRKAQYDEYVKTVLPKERVDLWERCERDSWRVARKGSYDWALAKVALEQELKKAVV